MARCAQCRVGDSHPRHPSTVCGVCGIEDGTVNPSGIPRCDTCRLKRPDGSRRRQSKVCQGCGRRYTTTGGNNSCASCLHQQSKHPCADCGEPVDARAEVCRSCWGKRHGGANASAWKGGRVTKTVHGYVLIAARWHPRAKKSAGYYMREHVIVMEKKIGRLLLPGENVHHRNGVRHDNRPENLELWVVSQPAGQRASDLLDWARTIIDVYGPLERVLG